MKRYFVTLHGVVLAFFFSDVVLFFESVVANVFHDVSSMRAELRGLGGSGQRCRR